MSDKKVDSLQQFGIQIGNDRFGKLNIDKAKPVVKSILSKLVKPHNNNPQNLTQTRQGIEPPDGGWLEGVSKHTTNQINDSLNLFQLLPDTELAQQILISSILSPKDMVNTELNYVVEDEEIDGEVSGALIQVVEDYFDRVYKIKPKLSDILSEALFTKGSYPTAILPETSIDELINADKEISVESLTEFMDKDGYMKPMGFLGSPNKRPPNKHGISLESYSKDVSKDTCPVQLSIRKFETRLTVTDNLNVLKIPAVHSKLRQTRIKGILENGGISLEALPEDDKFYRQRHYKMLPIIGMTEPDDASRDNIGHPLVLKLSPEAVIPVHTPGDPSDHIGYFILLDPNGYPISQTKESNYYSDFTHNLTQNRDMVSNLIKTSNRALNGVSQDPVVNPEKVTQIYAELIEENLLRRLRNGVYGETVEVARPLEVYRIMLARALANMNTQVLFLPCSLMSYIAFDFNRYGVGKSLLEDNKILAGIRAMLLFANTMAAIKNSVPKTGLNITLDPNDPDPASTVEFLVHEYAKNRQATYPLGASSPMDIVNFLQNAGIDLMVTGNPAYPETRMEVEDKNRSITEPNTELQDILKRDYLMSLGLSPESVDASYSVEFATSIVSSNLLLTKRVLLLQEKFTVLLTDFMRKYITYSKPLTTALKKIIKSKVSDATEVDKIFQNFLNAFLVTLPKPDTSKLDNQMEAYAKYEEALDKTLDAYFNSEFLDATAMGEQQDVVDSARAALKAYFLRKWLRENNVMPELLDLVLFDENKHPFINLMQEHADHMEGIGATLEGYMLNVAKMREERAKRLEENAEAEGIDDVKGDGSSSGGEDEETESDSGGEDDFGGDDNFSIDEEESEEPTEEVDGESAEDDVETEEESEEEDETATEAKPSTGGVIQPDEDR